MKACRITERFSRTAIDGRRVSYQQPSRMSAMNVCGIVDSFLQDGFAQEPRSSGRRLSGPEIDSVGQSSAARDLRDNSRPTGVPAFREQPQNYPQASQHECPEVLWSGCTLSAMGRNPGPQDKEQQKFAELQIAVERKIREAFPGASTDVIFRAEPSRHFFIYRKGRPSLRLDIELAPDSKTIHFAVTKAQGCFVLRRSATGEIQIFLGSARVPVNAAANLLLEPFLNARAPQ
jgi:hypothetical protein